MNATWYELPAAYGLPLSRFSVADIARYGRQSGLVATIGDSTIWRWLHKHAMRPWQHRCWIFPGDPDFATKAGRILDLYPRQCNGGRLQDEESVISADEKTSIQARHRRHATIPPRAGASIRVELAYARCGEWVYRAALDVHLAKLFGRCESKSGIAPFKRLVQQAMAEPPYREPRPVFWIVDIWTSHRGARCIAHLREKFPRLVPSVPT